MSEKLRIKKVINFKKTYKIPHQINYTNAMADLLMDTLKLKKLKYSILGKNIFAYNLLNDFFGNHIQYIKSEPVNSEKEIKTNIWEDEWKVLWDRRIDKNIGNPVNCLLEKMILKNIKIPDPDMQERFAHFKPIIDANEHRYIAVRFSASLFERAWALRGMENLLIDFIKNPEFVHELFNIITNIKLRIIKNLVNFKIDGIRFADDWGSQRSLLISPNFWRLFIMPYIKKLYAQAHIQGFDVIIHSCGNNTLILDDIVQVGVDVFNPLQPEVMNVRDTLDKYSNKLAFYGGLSIQKTLPFGTPEQVKIEIDNLIVLARKYGGLIISPSHDIPESIPVNNILTMVEKFKSQ